jgi:hypothetical protein
LSNIAFLNFLVMVRLDFGSLPPLQKKGNENYIFRSLLLIYVVLSSVLYIDIIVTLLQIKYG